MTVSNEHPDMHGNWVDDEICEECGGTGRWNDKPCEECGGTGFYVYGYFEDDVL